MTFFTSCQYFGHLTDVYFQGHSEEWCIRVGRGLDAECKGRGMTHPRKGWLTLNLLAPSHSLLASYIVY